MTLDSRKWDVTKELEKKYTVRPYEKGDEAEIVELLELVFEGWPSFDLKRSNLDYWKWKYKISTQYKNKIIVGINEKNEIVGCNHLRMNMDFLFGDKLRKICVGADSAVHPDYRKMGMFTKMDEIIDYSDIYAGISYTSNQIMKNYVTKFSNCMFPNKIYSYIKINDIENYSKHHEISFIKKTGYKGFATFKNILVPTRSEVAVRRIKIFDDGVTAFWENIRGNYKFCSVKDAEWLNYRYCDIRGGEYQLFLAEENRSVLGYCVTRVNKVNPLVPVGFIMELMCPVRQTDIADALLLEAHKAFNEQSVIDVQIWVSGGSFLEKIAKRHGYVNTRKNNFLYFDPITPNLDEKLTEISDVPVDSLNLQLGDLDLF